MRNKPSFLFAALLAASLPSLVFAQGAIVMPPAPPPGVSAPQPAGTAQPGAPLRPSPTPATAAVAPVAQLDVMPPNTVSGIKPTVTQAELIDVMLPMAPERPPAADLKPAAPKVKVEKKVVSTKKTDAEPKEKPPAIKLVDDPFAGVTGVPVSDSQLNRFVFPEPVEGVYFQEGAPLPDCPKEAGAQDPCKPVFLNGRRMMLLQLRAGAQGPVQMLVHLRSGRVATINLAPARGPGAVVRIDGAEDGASDVRLAEAKAQAKAASGNTGGMAATEQDVALLSRFARGDIPAGFETVPAGPALRYDLFDVVPMATWSNGATMRAHLLQVRALSDAPVAINPGLFRGPSVKALALDRDTITAKAPAMLYMLEQLPAEAQ